MIHLSPAARRKLDNFGPYGSGIGTVIWFLLTFFFEVAIPISITLIIVYFLNTCQHRIYRFVSKSAIAGVIGAFIGICTLEIIAYLLIYFHSDIIYLFILSIYLFLIPFSFARYFCKRERKREMDSGILHVGVPSRKNGTPPTGPPD